MVPDDEVFGPELSKLLKKEVYNDIFWPCDHCCCVFWSWLDCWGSLSKSKMITKHREEYEKALAKPLTACKEQKLIDFVDAFMNVASKIYEATTYDNKKQAEEGIYSLPNYVLIDLHLLIQKAHDIQLSATPANKRLIRPLDDRDEKIAGLHVELGNQEVELTRMRNELGILKIIQNNMFNELDSTKKELITITAERNAAILEVLRFKEKLRILKIWGRAY